MVPPRSALLPAYVPGKKGLDAEVIKLASNETPFPTLPQVQAVIAAASANMNRYADMAATDLVADIALFHEWPDTGIAVGNGSTALIEKILQAVTTPGGEIVIPWRSFEAYPIAIQAAGGVAVKVPLVRGHQDLRAMAQAVTPRTRAVMVCSPNNPTGTAVTHTDLSLFLSEIPASIPVILDEAYIDFVEMDDAVDSSAFLREHDNLYRAPHILEGLRLGGVALRVCVDVGADGGRPPGDCDAFRRERLGAGGGSGGLAFAAAGTRAGRGLEGRAHEADGRSGGPGLGGAGNAIELRMV